MSRLARSGAMRASRYFLATLKEAPSDAELISHKLMVRAGLIRRLAGGIYTWMPLGLRVVRKVETIVREEMNRAGALELFMPSVQPAELWKESGRWQKYGPELLRFKDRHERDFCMGPTHEEVITDVARREIRSYRQLPVNFYQIQTKFRDEIRPRFGVMRGREFLMKDAYSFDIDSAGARHSYNKMFVAYLRTFARMGLKAIPMRAETGPIGGDLSHEFIILADTGESAVHVHRDFIDADWQAQADLGWEAPALQEVVDRYTSLYAATDDVHDAQAAEVYGDKIVSRRGIEVGQIFYFGNKYSQPMGAFAIGRDGEQVALEMGSYGIGVSRLVGALIEANHDDAGILWPASVAPFRVGLINLRPGDLRCRAAADDCYGKLQRGGIEVLYDDRDESPGVKFATMDLIGLPEQIIVGPRGLAAGIVEVKDRGSGDRRDEPIEAALNRLLAGSAGSR